jgi:hypothetical protein
MTGSHALTLVAHRDTFVEGKIFIEKYVPESRFRVHI